MNDKYICEPEDLIQTCSYKRILIYSRTYNTVLYYLPEDFKELRGSPAFEDALKQFKYIARQYAYFYKKFQAMILRDYFTFDEYRWAVSTVMTRQNQVCTSEQNLTIRDRLNERCEK